MESFIRPPVNIYLTFPCNIDIDRVLLHGIVGAQRSTSYELFSFSASRKPETAVQRWEAGTSREPAQLSDVDGFVYASMGRLWQKNDKCADVVCFYNPYFRPRSPYSVLSAMPSKFYNQESVNVEMRAQHIKNLASVSHLVVRITKTLSGGVPALRWVEVWGQPSASCPKQDVDRVLGAYNNIMGRPKRRRPPSVVEIVDSQTQVSPPPPPVPSHSPLDTSVSPHGGVVSPNPPPPEIPEDFLDPLTVEVMALPMLLPSGQSVDHSTLEKYNEGEAKYGRHPNNPFTAVPFTANCKPIPNAALKARIDYFLLTNPTQATNIGQTLGMSAGLLAEKRSGRTVAQTSVLLNDQPQAAHLVNNAMQESHLQLQHHRGMDLSQSTQLDGHQALRRASFPGSLDPSTLNLQLGNAGAHQKQGAYQRLGAPQKPDAYPRPDSSPRLGAPQKLDAYSRPGNYPRPDPSPRLGAPQKLDAYSRPGNYPRPDPSPRLGAPQKLDAYSRPGSYPRPDPSPRLGAPQKPDAYSRPDSYPRPDPSPRLGAPQKIDAYSRPDSYPRPDPFPRLGAAQKPGAFQVQPLAPVGNGHQGVNNGVDIDISQANSSLDSIGGTKRPAGVHTKSLHTAAKRPRTHSAAVNNPSQSPVIDLTSDSDHEDHVSNARTTQRLSTTTTVIRRNPAASHELNLKNSLDTAIDSTLANLPTFGNPIPSGQPEVSNVSSSSAPGGLASEWKASKLECIFCTLYREMGVLYRLACGDVACRDCLSCRRRSADVMCDKCGRTTRTRDIAKIHAI